VNFGTSVRQIAGLVEQEVHRFDGYEGLPEAWHREPKGSYTTKGVIPTVPENVILHKGWFEDTLPGSIIKFQAPVRFMNIDCDIYSATKTVPDSLYDKWLDHYDDPFDTTKHALQYSRIWCPAGDPGGYDNSRISANRSSLFAS
jgi:hypothetical protein